MKLNHIDLQVSNVSAAREFFETHFGLRCTFQRREQLAIMEDDDGLAFGVSNRFGAAPPIYPPDFHVRRPGWGHDRGPCAGGRASRKRSDTSRCLTQLPI